VLHCALLAICKTGVADCKHPKDRRNKYSHKGKDANASEAVEDGIEDEAAPIFSDEKIQGRNEDEAEIDHIFKTLSFWLFVWDLFDRFFQCRFQFSSTTKYQAQL
jgi:hypothetical protein